MDALDQAMGAYGGSASASDPLDAAMADYAPKPLPAKAGPTKPPPLVDPGFWNVIKNAAAKGIAGLGDMIPNAAVNTANLGIAGYGTAKHLITGSNDLPDLIPSDALSGYEKMAREGGLIQDKNEPTTGAERVADFTTQVATGGGVNPRSVLRAASTLKAIPLIRDAITPVAGGVTGGLTQEGTRQLDPDTWYGRAANAVLPALAQFAGSYPTGRMSTAGERASQTTKNVTPAQWDQADALAQKAAAQGAPLTAAEAIQGVTGNNPGLQSLQRVTEQSTAGVNNLAPAFAQRPAQNASLINNVVEGIHPREVAPDAIAGTLQSAAERAIKAAQEARSNAAGPLYQAQRLSDANTMSLVDQLPGAQNLVTDRLGSRDRAVQTSGQLMGLQNDMTQTAKDYHPVAGMPGFPARYLPHTDVASQAGEGAQEAYAISRQRLREAQAAQAHLDQVSDALAQKNLPEIQGKVGALLSGLDQQIRVAGPTVEGKFLQSFRDELAPNGNPIVYPSQLESVYRNNRNKLDPGAFASPEDRTRMGVLGPQVQNLNSLIQDVSPTIAAGRAAYAKASSDLVDPLKFGQVGKLARSDSFVDQANQFLPQSPMDVTPGTIANTTNAISAQDPAILRRFLAQHLRGTFNEANQDLQNGANQFGGAKFAARIAGNDMQAQNLTQALQSSGASPGGLLDALDIFRAQGTRPATGSATTFNNGEVGLLGGGLLASIGKPLQIPGLLAEKAGYSMSTKGLTKALQPDATTVQRLRELARANGSYFPMDQASIAALVRAANSATRPAEQAQ